MKHKPLVKHVPTAAGKKRGVTRAAGGGRNMSPLHVVSNGHGGEVIVITVTHLTLAQRQAVLESNQVHWETEREGRRRALRDARAVGRSIMWETIEREG